MIRLTLIVEAEITAERLSQKDAPKALRECADLPQPKRRQVSEKSWLAVEHGRELTAKVRRVERDLRRRHLKQRAMCIARKVQRAGE
jgi:hypothetical protein